MILDPGTDVEIKLHRITKRAIAVPGECWEIS
jgi:hypothetical protein